MVIILNRGAGPGEEGIRARIVELFQSRGVAPKLLVARDGGEVPRLAEEAVRSDAKVVVAAGGDGTIDGIAAALAGTEKILGVLPLGTFNLFAQRLNLPASLEAAVETVVGGRVTEVNLGEVNDWIFLNRSSVGLYPMALRQRERLYRRFGRSRFIALLGGATALLRWSNMMTIRLKTETGEYSCRSRFVFVCNNPDELDYFDLQGREWIEENKLAVYLPKALSTAGILRLGFRMLMRRARENRDFAAFCGREVRLEIEPANVPVSLDGEVKMMKAPLCYRLRLRALKVRVPA